MKCFAMSMGIFLVPVLWPAASGTEDCITGGHGVYTNDFFFSLSSEQGAVGDVVGVEVSLTTESPRKDLAGIHVFGCYDGSLAELLPSPEYTEVFDQIADISGFWRFEAPNGPPQPLQGGTHSFRLWIDVSLEARESLFPTPAPLHLATLFFRLKGRPGDSFQVRCCDDEWREISGACIRNHLYYIAGGGGGGDLATHSTRHVPGEIRILEGPATHPDPPSLPPDARAYDDPPTPETANIRYEMMGAIAQPGTDDVPVPILVTSNHEFSGFLISVTFPQELLELTRVEEHVRPGIVKVDNAGGVFGLLMLNSNRRVGAEGERALLATLHFRVKDAARAVDSIHLKFEDVPPYGNRLGIRYRQGLALDSLPITAEVAPIVLAEGLLKVQNRATSPGDANFDFQVDMSDAVAVLTRLFIDGAAPLCWGAADFDRSSNVNITDAIAILNFLFLGQSGPGAEEVSCDPR